MAKAAAVRAGRPRFFPIDDVRCPTCARRLVLRSGPAITAHFAHRPRQSCRSRPGRAAVRPLRLEQLTLFELEPEPVPTFYWEPAGEAAPPRPRRRRRKAWLPRLIRWIKALT
jgi:hypothetical protein